MIYTPKKNSKSVMDLITVIVFLGIAGGIIFSLINSENKIYQIFPLLALLFWAQFTIVLSYRQFKKKKELGYETFTEMMLHFPIRLFLFLVLAILGIFQIFIGNILISYGILFVWWLFALMFYSYYNKRKEKTYDFFSVIVSFVLFFIISVLTIYIISVRFEDFILGLPIEATTNLPEFGIDDYVTGGLIGAVIGTLFINVVKIFIRLVSKKKN
jgi:hypothetical protein